MASTRLILVRHGESVWNLEGRYQGQLDSRLTPKGLAQSGALAARLAGHKFVALYSSDLGRAMQTAEVIAEQTGHRILTDSRLRERHLGIFQSLSKKEIKQKFAEEYRLFKAADPHYVVPGGESASQACTRMRGCLEELARRHVGESMAVVAHGGVLSVLFRHTLMLTLEAPRRFERRNASWNAFRCDDGKWVVETWGDVSHLGGNS